MNSSLAQRLHNLIQIGVIAEVDTATARCRVHIHTRTSAWLPWLTLRAGSSLMWSAPDVGEQVLVLAPNGHTTAAVVLCGLYSNRCPAPAQSAAIHRLRFADGAQLDYDQAHHALSAVLPAGGTATVTASGGITLIGPLTVNGSLQLNGSATISQSVSAQSVTAQSDVIGGGISLKNHVHSGVLPGPSSTGPPL